MAGNHAGVGNHGPTAAHGLELQDKAKHGDRIKQTVQNLRLKDDGDDGFLMDGEEATT